MLAASLASSGLARADGASTGKARLTVEMHLEETNHSTKTPNNEAVGDDSLSVTGMFSQNVIVEKNSYGGIETRNIPDDEATAADKPQGAVNIRYAMQGHLPGTVETQTFASGGADGDSAGGDPDQEFVLSSGVPAGMASVTLELHARPSGHCHESTKDWTSDSCADMRMVGGWTDLLRIPGGDNEHPVGKNGPAELALEISVSPQEQDTSWNGGGWKSTATTGSFENGFTLTFDGTKKFDNKEGETGTRHLHIVARSVPLSRQCKLDGDMLKHAYDRAFRAAHIAVPPEYIKTSQHDPHFLGYAMRIRGDDALLPTQDWLRNAVAQGAQPQAGARYLLVGSVQLLNDAYRVNVRYNDVQTAVVLGAARGNAMGCDDGLDRAVAQALSRLKPQPKGYAP